MVVFPTPPFPLIAIFTGFYPVCIAFPGKVIKIKMLE
jgi:hypothetical protein